MCLTAAIFFFLTLLNQCKIQIRKTYTAAISLLLNPIFNEKLHEDIITQVCGNHKCCILIRVTVQFL